MISKTLFVATVFGCGLLSGMVLFGLLAEWRILGELGEDKPNAVGKLADHIAIVHRKRKRPSLSVAPPFGACISKEELPKKSNQQSRRLAGTDNRGSAAWRSVRSAGFNRVGANASPISHWSTQLGGRHLYLWRRLLLFAGVRGLMFRVGRSTHTFSLAHDTSSQP
jgi:hypothetical protein